jgi:hypothetical protein
MRTALRWIFTVALVCGSEGEGLAQKKGLWKSVVAYLDSSNVKGVDPAYIILPDKPWAVVLDSNVDKLSLNMSSTTDGEFYSMWWPCLCSP